MTFMTTIWQNPVALEVASMSLCLWLKSYMKNIYTLFSIAVYPTIGRGSQILSFKESYSPRHKARESTSER